MINENVEDEGIMWYYKLTAHDVNQWKTTDSWHSLYCIHRKSVKIKMFNVFFLN